jgi:hypothetical protein
MLDPRRDEENVTWPEAMAFLAIPKPAAPLNHGVHLIPRMGRLGVAPARRIELDTQGSVAEQLDKPLAFGAWQSGHAITNRQVMMGHQ